MAIEIYEEGMLMISIALCDDEVDYLSFYETKINNLAKKLNVTIEIIKFTNGDALLFHLEDRPNHFDIMFLDILMGKTNGIDIARKVKNLNPTTKIIFLTTSENFVYDAFSVGPLNYLIKGRDEQKLISIITPLLTNTVMKEEPAFFTHETRTKKLFIPYHEIVYFEVYRRIVIIHLQNKETYQIYKQLGELEDDISKLGFIRTHRAYLVNMQYIKNISNASLVLKNNHELPVGRKYYFDIRNKLSEYLRKD